MTAMLAKKWTNGKQLLKASLIFFTSFTIRTGWSLFLFHSSISFFFVQFVSRQEMLLHEGHVRPRDVPLDHSFSRHFYF
jgi:hypothetical protein